MTDVPLRETWRERARDADMPLWRLAVLTGVSPSTVASYARGARRPTDEWLARADVAIRSWARDIA